MPTEPAGSSGAPRVIQTSSRALYAVVGASAAAFAANLYYAQPLLTTIAADLRIAPEIAGSIVSVSQFGYGVGLFLLVPLSDMVENRRLVLTCSFLAVIGIIGIATARSATAFLCFAAITGIFSSGAQVLIPYLSHLMPADRRGRLIGTVMAGILTSVVLARPFSLFVAAAFGWRTVYWLAASVTILLGLSLWRMMPRRQPERRIPYRQTITSMFVLFASERPVRRRAIYQAILFGTFTMFWAVIPILLADRFGYGKTAIGLFALVGVGGAFAAPLAGRIADRGGSWIGMIAVSLIVSGAFLLSMWSIHLALPIALAITSLLIDGSVQVSQVLSRIVVLDVTPGIRGRINALYMTITFLSGACGSILSVSVYFAWGWTAVASLGAMGGMAVFLALLWERRENLWPRRAGKRNA